MRELKDYSDIKQMSRDAAWHIREYITEVLGRKDSCSLVLSGGNFVQNLYRTLFYIDSLPWEKIHFFITDERCLSRQDQNSNLKNAVNSLFKRTNIPLQNIHWINTNIIPLEKSVSEYERTLNTYLEKNGGTFDLLLLSMGPDGHVASLFTGFTALLEKKKLVVQTEKALLDPRVQRITMTVPALNKSERIMFFISDENCGSVIDEILNRNKEDKFTYPAELIKGTGDEQIWYILRTRI